MLSVRLFVILACALAAAGEGVAQTYPARPIRIIVPFPPGGLTDPLARLLGEQFRKSLGQPVVIENKPGAGTVIGVDAVAKSAADGYTLGMVGNSFTVNVALVPKLPYDTVKDLRAVALLVRSPNVLAGRPGVAARDLRELVAYAKANPGKLTYASSGNGTMQHLIGESMRLATGMDLVHVPYRGGGPALSDLLGGQVDLMVGNLSTVLPHIRAGKVRAFAVSTAVRSAVAPEVATLGDHGYPEIDMSAWFGLIAPAAVPGAVVARLNAEAGRVLSSPEVSGLLLGQGMEPIPASIETFEQHIRSEIEKYKTLVKQANIRLD
jgi:tripartite-type tricarboxylate transporter receptor subunit TctC